MLSTIRLLTGQLPIMTRYSVHDSPDLCKLNNMIENVRRTGLISLIGLIGRNGSGKSAVCDWFKTQGYAIISLSDEVRRVARAQNKPETRAVLTEIGTALKADHGPDILAHRALAHYKTLGGSVVFDSIRHPDEVRVLTQAGVLFIGVSAPLAQRYQRIKDRNNARDNVDFETFKAQDDQEFYGTSGGQHIQACWDQCRYYIDNQYDSLDSLWAFMKETVPRWIG